MNLPIKITYRSIRLVTDALIGRGFTCKDIPAGPGFREFCSPTGRTWLTNRALLTYPFISNAAAEISRNKRLAYQFAEHSGMSIPRTLYIPEQSTEIEKFLVQSGKAIVKPLTGYGSHGLTMDIVSQMQLQEAIQDAYAYDSTAIVQEQFDGQEVRFTILDGKVAHCLLRETPRVVGNGHDSVAELIVRENDYRRSMQHAVVPYPVLDDSIIPARFFQDESIPADGELIELSKSTLVASGASMCNITTEVDASYIRAAELLAEHISPEFLTIDMLIQDYTQPAQSSNYVFLECNTAPSLRLYYDVRTGSEFDIVNKLADKIDAWIATK